MSNPKNDAINFVAVMCCVTSMAMTFWIWAEAKATREASHVTECTLREDFRRCQESFDIVNSNIDYARCDMEIATAELRRGVRMYLSTNSLDVDPGEGWRLLKPHELVEEGDEFRRYTTWTPSENWKSETRKQDSSAGPYRRRLTADGKAASKDDYLNAASTCIECQ